MLQHNATRSDLVGAETSNSPPPGIEPQNIQPVVWCYTDLALPPGGTLVISWLYSVDMSEQLPVFLNQQCKFSILQKLSIDKYRLLESRSERFIPEQSQLHKGAGGPPNGHACSCA